VPSVRIFYGMWLVLDHAWAAKVAGNPNDLALANQNQPDIHTALAHADSHWFPGKRIRVALTIEWNDRRVGVARSVRWLWWWTVLFESYLWFVIWLGHLVSPRHPRGIMMDRIGGRTSKVSVRCTPGGNWHGVPLIPDFRTHEVN
jgi:hypothetical protein